MFDSNMKEIINSAFLKRDIEDRLNRFKIILSSMLECGEDLFLAALSSIAYERYIDHKNLINPIHSKDWLNISSQASKIVCEDLNI